DMPRTSVNSPSSSATQHDSGSSSAALSIYRKGTWRRLASTVMLLVLDQIRMTLPIGMGPTAISGMTLAKEP
ncbi:MAG: hypothetical protein ACR2QJ_10160, partial [Geminicoccaceae bacterium]